MVRVELTEFILGRNDRGGGMESSSVEPKKVELQEGALRGDVTPTINQSQVALALVIALCRVEMS